MQILEEFLENTSAGQALQRAQASPDGGRGVLSKLVNNITASGSFLFGALNAVNQMAFQGASAPASSLPSGRCSRSAGGCLWAVCCRWASGAFSGEPGISRHALPPRVFALPRALHAPHGLCDAGKGCKTLPVGAYRGGPAGEAVFLPDGALYPCRKPLHTLPRGLSPFQQHDEGL